LLIAQRIAAAHSRRAEPLYTLDAVVNSIASAGMAIFSLELAGNGTVATPVVGRIGS
jgi:hypothetical protein